MVQMEDSFDSNIYSGDNFSSSLNDSTPNPAFQYPLPIFLILFFIIGLPWNALVIGIIFRKNLFTRPSVMLMLSLAITVPPVFRVDFLCFFVFFVCSESYFLQYSSEKSQSWQECRQVTPHHNCMVKIY